MNINEAKQIISEMSLSQEALDRANEILEAVVNKDELSNSEIDMLLAIIDSENEADELEAKACEEVSQALETYLGETEAVQKEAEDAVVDTATGIYEEVKKGTEISNETKLSTSDSV
jgi:hypothetical protein